MIFLTFVSTHCDKSSQTALLSQSVIQQLALYHFILIKWPFHPGLPLWPLQLSLLMWMKLEEHMDLAPASLACLHLRIFHIADEGHEWCKRNLRSAHVFTVSYGKLVVSQCQRHCLVAGVRAAVHAVCVSERTGMACWYIVTDIRTDHFFMGPLNSHKKQRHTHRCKLCFVVLCYGML